MICLENDSIKVWIKPKGAEMKSLVSKKSGIDYIWEANPYHWANSSPVLFPIVGALKDGSYTFEGEWYTMKRHGFARDMVFEVEKKSVDSATFVLRANTETLAIYPFQFALRISYKLLGARLSVGYEVQNTGGSTLYFSIGAHPAFAIPFDGQGNYSDYNLLFAADKSLQRWLLNEGGLISGETRQIDLDNGRLSLSKELFFDDALVMKHLASDEVVLSGHEGEEKLRLRFRDFQFFGIWAAKNAPFVCLEPWCGIADSTTHNQELAEKEGINTLDADGVFARSWSVEVV